MNYRSTRDTSLNPKTVSSAEAVKEGLAPDGGLYIPEYFPKFTDEDFKALCGMSYPERAAFVLGSFMTDYDRDALLADCRDAYSESRFPGGAAPIHALNDGIYSLELWHGPTSAFKDMALQIMPRLLSRALTMTGEKRTAHILVATSGDTGKAALEGYSDVNQVKITVFYPVDGVSDMQKRQMKTTLGSNVNVVAVHGNFDDAQNGVKAIFSDRTLAEKADSEGFFFGSANSINWGRLAPQIVYYISAYCDLVNTGKIGYGEKINICVPTGNFGNIFAAYIARETGLPVNRFICASNTNNVLTDFFRTGTYDRTREFHKTISPSMDILISSNLERLLAVTGGSELTSALMSELKTNGKYTIPDELKNTLSDSFRGYWLDEKGTKDVIGRTYNEENYLIDPHTAVGLGCIGKYREETGDKTPVVLASTASPFKFAPAVADALGMETLEDGGRMMASLSEKTGVPVPAPLENALHLPVRFERVIDPAEMPAVPFGG